MIWDNRIYLLWHVDCAANEYETSKVINLKNQFKQTKYLELKFVFDSHYTIKRKVKSLASREKLRCQDLLDPNSILWGGGEKVQHQGHRHWQSGKRHSRLVSSAMQRALYTPLPAPRLCSDPVTLFGHLSLARQSVHLTAPVARSSSRLQVGLSLGLEGLIFLQVTILKAEPLCKEQRNRYMQNEQ